MRFDEEDLRRALDARSGAPSDEYRSRLRRVVANAPAGAGTGWMAVIAVIVVTVLTATSVGALVGYRHSQRSGASPSSSARAVSPAPTPTGVATAVQLSAPLKGIVWALVDGQSLYVSTDGGGHWQRRTLPDGAVGRPSIAFLNDSEGWLLASGSPATQCEQQTATIWQTTDGAMTWRRLPASGILDAQCKDGIYFTDVGHGFVTASDANHRPTVYATTDDGVTWTRSTLPDNPLFVTGSGGFTLHVGWIKGFGNDFYLEASGSQDDPSWHDRDFIYTSTNGGVTWTWKQKLASPYTYMVTELRWLQLAPDVMESVNGGQAFGLYKTDLKVTPPFTADFVNADHGYVVSGADVQQTSDGGAHWTQVGTPWRAAPVAGATPTPSEIPMPGFAELSAPSAAVVWALVNGQYLFVSTDQGATWQQRSVPALPAGSVPLDISFVDADVGWLTTCPGSVTNLWRTADGGRSWQPAGTSPSPAGTCLRGLYFVDATHGFLSTWDAGIPPAIYRTGDGARTWTRSTLPYPPGTQTPGARMLHQITIKAFGGVMLAVGDAGSTTQLVFRSTDAGATWSYVATLPSGVSNATLVTETTWLSISNDGSAARTTDGGKTWHAFQTDYNSAAPVWTIFVFVTPDVGYGTVRGSVDRTVDGGAHWKPLKVGWP